MIVIIWNHLKTSSSKNRNKEGATNDNA